MLNASHACREQKSKQVRPGVTGLWQVNRTRRDGSDFQEWIRYDLEYVEKRSFWMDMQIIWETVAGILGKVSKS